MIFSTMSLRLVGAFCFLAIHFIFCGAVLSKPQSFQISVANKADRALFDAMRANDLPGVQKILAEKQVKLNLSRDELRSASEWVLDNQFTVKNGTRFLTLAAAMGNYHIVEALIEAGAQINNELDDPGQYDWGRYAPVFSPLYAAAFYGHVEVLSLLFDKGGLRFVEQDTTDAWQVPTLLHTAAASGAYKMIQYLIRIGFKPTTLAGANARTALDVAVRNAHLDKRNKTHFDHLKAIDLLMTFTDGEFRHLVGGRALRYAPTPKVAKLLMRKGADKTYRSEDGWTALHGVLDDFAAGDDSMWAPSSAHDPKTFYKLVALLIHSDTINVQTDRGHSPLSIALINHHIPRKVIRLLISSGADVNIRDDEGNTLAHDYINWHDEVDKKVLQWLLKAGVDVNAQNLAGQSLLYRAAKGGDLGLVIMLLQKKAQPDLPDAEGHTPADVAEQKGYKVVAQLLRLMSEPKSTRVPALAQLQSQKKRDQKLWKALDDEYFRGAVEAVQQGADVNARRGNYFPLDNLMRHLNPNVLSLGKPGRRRYAADNIAVVEAVHRFVELGADVTLTSDQTPPLYIAACIFNLNLVKLFVEAGADVNRKSSPMCCTARTPLQAAQKIIDDRGRAPTENEQAVLNYLRAAEAEAQKK